MTDNNEVGVLDEARAFIIDTESYIRNATQIEQENAALKKEVEDNTTEMNRYRNNATDDKRLISKLMVAAKEDQIQKQQLMQDLTVGISAQAKLCELQYKVEAMKSQMFALEQQINILTNENERLIIENSTLRRP